MSGDEQPTVIHATVPEATVIVTDGHDDITYAPFVILVVSNETTAVVAPLTPERAEAVAHELQFWAVAARNR
jgi:hypothetical protein